MSSALAEGLFTTGAMWEALRRLQNHRKVGRFKNIILKRQIYLYLYILSEVTIPMSVNLL